MAEIKRKEQKEIECKVREEAKKRDNALEAKVNDLSQKISTSRDTQISEMTQLKVKVIEHNRRLEQLSQEKTKMDAETNKLLVS